MTDLPRRFRDIARVTDEAWALVRETPGYLSEREARFIVAAAALAPAKGANLEIGSFKGRSSVGIAHVLRHYDLGKLVAVDPHTSPSPTDPKLAADSSYDEFLANLGRARVTGQVEPFVMRSEDLARQWDRPIRFLWIDGDHTYPAARADVEMFRRFLQPGALLLMHDVLGTHYGSLRAFVEHVLGSDNFGPAGYCGSVGWAQYRPDDGGRLRYRVRRKLLAIPARRIIPVAQSGLGLVGANKLKYKIWRPLAPHGEVRPEKLWSWIRMG